MMDPVCGSNGVESWEIGQAVALADVLDVGERLSHLPYIFGFAPPDSDICAPGRASEGGFEGANCPELSPRTWRGFVD